MGVSSTELIDAISTKRLVLRRIDRHQIHYEPHLYGRNRQNMDVVIVREAPSRDNWSEPGVWRTLSLLAIDEIDTRGRFPGALEIPLEHLATIEKIYAQVKHGDAKERNRRR